MADRVYHWKHGWIPLTHTAALSKAHGSEAGAKRLLDPVKREHLPRKAHVVAGHSSSSKAFVVHDKQTGHTANVPEKRAESLHSQGHSITAVHKSGAISTADPSGMTPDELDHEVAQLAASGDFGPRMEALAAEMDKRDSAKVDVSAKPDPIAEQRALNKLLFGSEDPPETDLSKRRESSRPAGGRDKALRDEYESWVLSQYVTALDVTNGQFYSKEGRVKSREDTFHELDFFNGRLSPPQIRKYASPELLEWFGSSGNPRLSFSEWRSFIVNDKQGRAAQRRVKERTLSEWG